MFHLTSLTPSDLTYRPLFLPILCLLTFFGSVTGLVFNSLGYFNAETLVNRIASKGSNSRLRVLDYSDGDLSNPSIRIGNITVAELLALKVTANIKGEIVTSKLSIEPGANFSGSCSMGGVVKDLKHAEGRDKKIEKTA